MINLKDIKIGDMAKLTYPGRDVFRVVQIVGKGRSRGWVTYTDLNIHGSPFRSHVSKMEEDQFHSLEVLPAEWGGFVPTEVWESISSPREVAVRALVVFPYMSYYGSPRANRADREQMIRWLASQELPEEAHVREILLSARDTAGRLDALRERVGLVPGQVRKFREGQYRVVMPSREIFSPEGRGLVWSLSLINPTTSWDNPTVHGLEDEILAKSELVDDSAASWLAW